MIERPNFQYVDTPCFEFENKFYSVISCMLPYLNDVTLESFFKYLDTLVNENQLVFIYKNPNTENPIFTSSGYIEGSNNELFYVRYRIINKKQK